MRYALFDFRYRLLLFLSVRLLILHISERMFSQPKTAPKHCGLHSLTKNNILFWKNSSRTLNLYDRIRMFVNQLTGEKLYKNSHNLTIQIYF